MQSTPRDYTIFDKFNFERKPVGIKFLLNKPDGINKLDTGLAFCEMFRKAQDSEPFYAKKDNFACMGSLLLGMKDLEPIFESGEIGATDGIYQEARANRRIYQDIPKLAKDTVRYVAFSPVDKLSFNPDIIVFTASVSQAEILLRALSYSTGKISTTRTTPAIMCAWLFVYPFVSGEANYSITGLGYGMKARKVFPEGLMLISLPYDLLPALTVNLQEMKWVLPAYALSDDERNDYFKKATEGIMKRYLDS
ncbi:MAG: DUF169 domain-containing protein [Dehalococcoidales bacterium]|nr:DUF169 domain-containing protein [Dehalococcoidales bacterium]